MKKHRFYKVASVCLLVAILIGLVVGVCGCHVFAWYIPKQYSDEQMEEIYAYLKDELLDKLEHIIAYVGYEKDGLLYGFNVFASEGKVIISYDIYGEANIVTRGLYYDGTLKEWDAERRVETVTMQSIAEYEYLFDKIRTTAYYFKQDVLNVMPYTDDSYCHECFPWGMGMAQMYYVTDDNTTVSASWTVEKRGKTELPLIHSADFNRSNREDSVSIQSYGSPYGIDERITNIIASYEEDKQMDEKMLYKQIYIKTTTETLCMELYNNDAAKTLYEKLTQENMTIVLDDYGGFEKVGELGLTLPTSDERITTSNGDVMLYQGNKIVIFYGQNTWEYTPLGFVTGYSDAAFADVIDAGEGKITITLTLSMD